jgi:hypothetical protein
MDKRLISSIPPAKVQTNAAIKRRLRFEAFGLNNLMISMAKIFRLQYKANFTEDNRIAARIYHKKATRDE